MELFYLNCSPHLNLSLFVSDNNSVKNMNASIYIYKELTMFQTCDTQVEEGVQFEKEKEGNKRKKRLEKLPDHGLQLAI